MIEQKIEKIVIDKIDAALKAADVTSFQIVGAWQTAVGDEQLKALEDSHAENFIGIKVSPRQYETPTIPDGSFLVSLSLATRAEMDKQGANWLAATEVISNLLQSWQSKFSTFQNDFVVEDEFLPSGFNLAGGDCGLDQASYVWQYTQTFNIYGVIK